MNSIPNVNDLLSSQRGYVICSTPRSGSTYLAYLLKATGVLGNPLEWIRADGGAADINYLNYPTDTNSQLNLILTKGKGSTPNKIYGLKMFPEHFDARADSRWTEVLPNLSYIYLYRQDILAQAISLSLARQTGSYQRRQLEVGDAVYSRHHINRCLEFTAEGEARWRIFFAKNNLTPLTFSYEDVVADPESVISKIANYVGVDVFPKVSRTKTTEIQRDARNLTWRQRFLADEGNLATLPPLRAGVSAASQDDPPDPDPSADIRLATQPGHNLLLDPGFITDLDWWLHFGNFESGNEWRLEETKQGVQCSLHIGGGPTTYSGWSNAWTSISPGDEIVLSAELEIHKGITGNIHCDLEWIEASGAGSYSPTLDAIAAGGFRRVSRRVVVPPSAKAFRFRFYASQLALSVGGHVSIRCPKVEMGRTASVYTDDSTLIRTIAKLRENSRKEL